MAMAIHLQVLCGHLSSSTLSSLLYNIYPDFWPDATLTTPNYFSPAMPLSNLDGIDFNLLPDHQRHQILEVLHNVPDLLQPEEDQESMPAIGNHQHTHVPHHSTPSPDPFLLGFVTCPSGLSQWQGSAPPTTSATPAFLAVGTPATNRTTPSVVPVLRPPNLPHTGIVCLLSLPMLQVKHKADVECGC